MDRPGDSQKPARAVTTESRSKGSPSGPKNVYLILYNAISALLWGVVLGRVLLIAPLHGYRNVYTGVGEFTKWTQTLAVLEIAHSLLGRCHTFPHIRPRTQRLSTLLLLHRHRPRPSPHNSYASRLPPPPRLAHRQHFPQHHRSQLTRLLLHAHRLERHRSHKVQLFRCELDVWRCTAVDDVVAV